MNDFSSTPDSPPLVDANVEDAVHDFKAAAEAKAKAEAEANEPSVYLGKFCESNCHYLPPLFDFTTVDHLFIKNLFKN